MGFCTPVLPRRAGSISWKQSLLLLSHTAKPSMSSWSEGAASRRSALQQAQLALRPPDSTLCSLACGVMQVMQDHLQPASMSTASPGQQAD